MGVEMAAGLSPSVVALTVRCSRAVSLGRENGQAAPSPFRMSLFPLGSLIKATPSMTISFEAVEVL